MKRNRYKFGGGIGAAAFIFAVAGGEITGAHAQVINLEGIVDLPEPKSAEPAGHPAPLTGEIQQPVQDGIAFIRREVVQPLPEPAAEPETATIERSGSLRELVARTPADEQLSEEMHCLAGAVYFESRGEPLAGQLAVAQVVINRSESSRFPDSYCGVVYQRKQFSFVQGGRMPAINTASQAWKNARRIARIAREGLWDSEADDSLYFHANYVQPRWARSKVARATINTHIFYR